MDHAHQVACNYTEEVHTMKKSSLILLSLLLVVTAASAPLFAGGQEEVDPDVGIEIDYWNIFTGPDGAYMEELVDRFNEEHEGRVRVNTDVMPAGDFYTQLPVAMQGDVGPDVAIVHIDELQGVIQQGLIQPLDEFAGDLDIDPGDIVGPVWEASHHDGSLYAVPLDVHPLVFYWNKDLFEAAGLDPERPPRDRAELIEFAEILTQDTNDDGDIDQWGTMIPVEWPNFFIWYSAFYSNGGQMFSDDLREARYNSPEGRDALQFLVDLVHEYEVSPPNVEVDANVDAFQRGTLAMEFNGIWMMGAYDGIDELNYGAAPVPQLGSERPAQWAGSHTIVMTQQRSPDPARQEAAATFVRWLSEQSLEWANAGQIPARVSLHSDPDFLQIPHMELLASGVENVAFPDFFPQYGPATGPVWEAINLALIGDQSVEQALDEAESVTNEILQEN